MLGLLPLSSCSDDDDGGETNITVYGQPYELTSGVFYENSPYVERTTVPYVFEDVYQNEGGETITDRVEGFTVGSDMKEFGNFMFSLYETGMVFNEELAQITGKGICLCFHLVSAETDRLVPGKYVYSAARDANTFIAYFSSEYNPGKSVTPAVISEGEVNIEEDGNTYHVVFNCKTTSGGEIVGTYDGMIRQVKINSQQAANYEGVTLGGAMKFSHYSWPLFGIDKDQVDNFTPAFFSTIYGDTRNASATGKESVDIALTWDRDNDVFRFESPIRVRSLLWHDATYNHPCHTIYMPAPDSFTDEDFENLDSVGFDFEVEDEPVTFKGEPFTKGFVFFLTGNGLKGVIRVNSCTPMIVVQESSIFGIISYEEGAKLLIDIKSEASFQNPAMR